MLEHIEHALISKQNSWSANTMEIAESLHAALSNKINCPRFYEINHGDNFSNLCGTITSDINDVSSKTIKSIGNIDVTVGHIKSLDFSTKQKCLALIEEISSQMLGDGSFFYEEERFTPLTNQDSHDKFNKYRPDILTPEENVILKALKKRHKNKINYILEYGKKAGYFEYRYLNSWNLSVRNKVDSEWQKTWLSNQNYQLVLHDEQIVKTIFVSGDLL